MGMGRALAACLAFSLIASSTGARSQDGPARTPVDPTLNRYADRSNSVRLPDGREFHLLCMGAGAPTVILTAGLGDWGAAWSTVQPQIARTTRVCAWDRAGFGLTEAAPGPQNVATTTADLEAGLAASGMPGPFVLVGHSLGGYESLLFADRHRKEVAGMVLVDPSFPDQIAVWKRVSPLLYDFMGRQQGSYAALLRKCGAEIGSGKVKLGGPDPDGCFDWPSAYSDELKAALNQTVADPLQYAAAAAFMESFAEDSRQVVNPARNYGAMPLIVLTATETQVVPGMTEAMQAEYDTFQLEWDKAHDALAALSSRGVNARVPGTSHYIQRIKPQVVIDAVEAVVAEARAAQD